MAKRLNYESLKKRDLVRSRGSDPFRSSTNKLMQSRYKSTCLVCKSTINPGDWINFYFETKIVKHQHCKLSGQPTASPTSASLKNKKSAELMSEAKKQPRAKRRGK